MERTWNLQLTVLGGLTAHLDGATVDLGGPKQRLVLALLLLAEGQPLTTDRLIDGVWGDDLPDRAEQSLQSYVSNLRKVLEPGRAPRQPAAILVTTPAGYALHLDRDQLDLTRFEHLASSTDPSDLAAALQLWAPLLPEFADLPVVEEHARRLGSIRDDVRERWLAVRLDSGETSSLVPDLRAAIADSPLDERFRRHLALALYRSGRQTDALRSLDEARRTLADEVGVDPGPALRQLEADILVQSPSLDLAVTTSAPASAPSTPIAPPTSGAPSAATDRRPFVGRERETATLVDALAGATAGTGTAVVISGEPGIGKTRLAEALADHARSHGVPVAWARCPESAATGPFHAVAELADQLTDAGIVDLSDRLGFEVVTEDTDRVGVYQRTVESLRRTTAPALLVIDDLQWADPGTLRLLEYVSGELRHLPFLVVVTTRPPGPDSGEPLVDCLAELARARGAVRLDVAGLDVAAVHRWIDARAEVRVGDEVAELVHDRSAGNPFFVQELVELLVGEDRLDTAALDGARVPAAVADVVRRRVGRLPATTQRLLSVASVVGRAFDLDVVADVADESLPAVLDALDSAVDAGLVAPDPAAAATFRFSHALVAEALETELSPSRRARLHAATAAAIARLRSARLDDHVAELAHHSLAGAVAGTAADAVDWCRRAASRAEAAHAPEDAAGHYGRALTVVDLAHPGDVAIRLDLLRRLGAAWSAAGSEERAHAALIDAVLAAEQLDDTSAMVDAALAMVQNTLWQPGEYGGRNDRLADAVDRVLARLTDDGHLAARLVLAGFRINLDYYSSDPADLDRRSAAIVELARRSDDLTLARVLAQRLQSVWFADTAAERVATARELLAVVRRSGGHPELEGTGELARLVAEYQLGEYDPDDLARVEAVVRRAGSPIQLLELMAFRAARSSSEGRYDEADVAADATEDAFRATDRRSQAPVVFGVRAMPLLDRGRLDELMAVAGTLGGDWNQAAAEMTGFVLLEFGMAEEARSAVGPVGSVPRFGFDWMWLAPMGNAALVRAGLGDVAAASALYEQFLPYSGQIAMAGSVPMSPSVDLGLSRLAATIGDRDAALRHIDDAIALETRMGTRAWLVRALEAKADLTGDPADRSAAIALATEIGCVPAMRRLGVE